MPTNPTEPMTKDQRDAAEAADQAAHAAAAAPDAPPPDPLARLRSALDAMNHQATLDIHDRLTSQANVIKVMADIMFGPPPAGGSESWQP